MKQLYTTPEMRCICLDADVLTASSDYVYQDAAGNDYKNGDYLPWG